MTKPIINKLGSVGLIMDGDQTAIPDAAFTDCMNVQFDGGTVKPYLGNTPANYYSPETDATLLMQPIMFDGFSNGGALLFMLTRTADNSICIAQQSMSVSDYKYLDVIEDDVITTDFDIEARWAAYKGQINNCPFFGQEARNPVGKQYDWTGFDLLPGWGEQTTGNDGTASNIVERRWTCKNLVSFDNRLLALSMTEESAAGVDTPYPTRIRWSGFAQENTFPINWDDTAANRTPEDYASVVINGFAGWQDVSSAWTIVDACANGGTLYVYTERETFSLTPSGDSSKPFVTKLVYSDLGCLDVGCVVNAHGYNYVFTGFDIVRHDSVTWTSIADGAVSDYLSEMTANHQRGMCRLINYPELSEIWVMLYGTEQDSSDYTKTLALTYNYVKKTWGKKSLPYINDAVFFLIPPTDTPKLWDENTGTWDEETVKWDAPVNRTAQGTLIGACNAGLIYVLNYGTTEYRHTYTRGAWTMQPRPLQCYVEKRGMEFSEASRSMITEVYLNGKGTNDITLALGRADNPDGGYTWGSQTQNLSQTRRTTWRTEGGVHAYRLEIAGQGDLPAGIKFTVKGTGR